MSAAGGAEPEGTLGGGHSIYKLQGRNQDLTIATKGNARKQIVSTLNEKTEDGKVWHEYYHKGEPGNKWWFDERSSITTATELNRALISKNQKVKGMADVRESNHETQQHLADVLAAASAAVRSAARTDRLAGGSGGQPAAVALAASAPRSTLPIVPPPVAADSAAAPASGGVVLSAKPMSASRISDLDDAQPAKGLPPIDDSVDYRVMYGFKVYANYKSRNRAMKERKLARAEEASRREKHRSPSGYAHKAPSGPRRETNDGNEQQQGRMSTRRRDRGAKDKAHAKIREMAAEDMRASDDDIEENDEAHAQASAMGITGHCPICKVKFPKRIKPLRHGLVVGGSGVNPNCCVCHDALEPGKIADIGSCKCKTNFTCLTCAQRWQAQCRGK